MWFPLAPSYVFYECGFPLPYADVTKKMKRKKIKFSKNQEENIKKTVIR